MNINYTFYVMSIHQLDFLIIADYYLVIFFFACDIYDDYNYDNISLTKRL